MSGAVHVSKVTLEHDTAIPSQLKDPYLPARLLQKALGVTQVWM